MRAGEKHTRKLAPLIWSHGTIKMNRPITILMADAGQEDLKVKRRHSRSLASECLQSTVLRRPWYLEVSHTKPSECSRKIDQSTNFSL